jgi:hypothetical protein
MAERLWNASVIPLQHYRLYGELWHSQFPNTPEENLEFKIQTVKSTRKNYLVAESSLKGDYEVDVRDIIHRVICTLVHSLVTI